MDNKVQKLATFSIFITSLVISQNVFSFGGGINGYSGNPATTAGNTCSMCHSGGTTPAVQLTGPATVQPGTISTFTFTISGGQQNSGGLNVSADGGTLMSTSTSTRLQNGEITHSQRATAEVDGTVSWNFDWQAPTVTGTYTIYSAGLSTNGDNSPSLDAVANDAFAVMVSSGAPQSPTAIILAPMTALADTTVSFDGSNSFDPDGTINQFAWDFDDSNTANGAQTTNIFTANGLYTVTLTVTDSDNLTNTTFRDITIGGVMVPVADPGGPYTGIAGEAVNIDGSLSNHVEAITNYIWDFGDGTPVVSDVVATISHTYAQAGAYTITLAVQDANVITGAASTTVVIDAPAPPPPVVDGPTLYTNNCAACHGALATSSKLNRSASQIQSAIDANTGGMGGFSGLTSTEVQAIADALFSATPPPPPPTDGPTLYTNNCSACHGPLATSSKLNRSASQIIAAIGANTGGMGGLNGLTQTEIQSIADALVTVTPPPPPPTDGPTLYDNNCSACHGALATSSKLNRSASQIQAAINANTGGMGGLSGLTPADLTAIADALVSTTPPPPPPTDGPTLYNNNCSACHGPLATSSKLNRSASQIQAAINANTGGMGGLSGLTSTDVQTIADALVSTTPPPPPPTDGASLYTNNCSACHGPLATSSKLNRSANQIQAAIDSNTGGMGGLSGLTPTEVTAIADVLVTGTPPPVPTTGKGLYDAYCLVCHGPGGTGGIHGAVTGESADHINNAIINEPLMSSISLEATQIQAIADYLAGSPPPPPPVTGQGLYDNYCLACHGPAGKGGIYEDVTGKSADKIADAINEVPLMNSITLNSDQLQSISDYLSGSGGGGTPPPAPTDGVTLYANNCSGCHGTLVSSSKLNRSASQIQAAIDANTGGMGGLSYLTSTNIQAIADALAGGGTTPPPPAPTDGATLYSNNCSGCHGPLASSSKLNRSASQIQAAIDANTGGMSGLSTLTPTEVQAIADALTGGGSTPPPATGGEQRYINLCQSCHGFNGTGGSAKAIVGVSAHQITNAVTMIGAMQNIVLTGTDAQDIASFLSSGGGMQPPPTTGEEIYAVKCAACHGPAGTGGTEEAIIGTSLSKIEKAMLEVTEMQPIPLSNGEAQALATYLSGDGKNDDGHGDDGHDGGDNNNGDGHDNEDDKDKDNDKNDGDSSDDGHM